jgi:hypothetical protein
VSDTWMEERCEFDSIRLATLTVSPNRQNLVETTAETTGPEGWGGRFRL